MKSGYQGVGYQIAGYQEGLVFDRQISTIDYCFCSRCSPSTSLRTASVADWKNKPNLFVPRAVCCVLRKGILLKQSQFWQRQMDVNTFETKDYEKTPRIRARKTKPNQTQSIRAACCVFRLGFWKTNPTPDFGGKLEALSPKSEINQCKSVLQSFNFLFFVRVFYFECL